MEYHPNAKGLALMDFKEYLSRAIVFFCKHFPSNKIEFINEINKITKSNSPLSLMVKIADLKHADKRKGIELEKVALLYPIFNENAKELDAFFSYFLNLAQTERSKEIIGHANTVRDFGYVSFLLSRNEYKLNDRTLLDNSIPKEFSEIVVSYLKLSSSMSYIIFDGVVDKSILKNRIKIKNRFETKIDVYFEKFWPPSQILESAKAKIQRSDKSDIPSDLSLILRKWINTKASIKLQEDNLREFQYYCAIGAPVHHQLRYKWLTEKLEAYSNIYKLSKDNSVYPLQVYHGDNFIMSMPNYDSDGVFIEFKREGEPTEFEKTGYLQVKILSGLKASLISLNKDTSVYFHLHSRIKRTKQTLKNLSKETITNNQLIYRAHIFKREVMNNEKWIRQLTSLSKSNVVRDQSTNQIVNMTDILLNEIESETTPLIEDLKNHEQHVSDLTGLRNTVVMYNLQVLIVFLTCILLIDALFPSFYDDLYKLIQSQSQPYLIKLFEIIFQ